MAWSDLGTALALVLVLEGFLPFINPQRAQATMRKVAELNPQTFRMLGLVSMVCGVLLLALVR